MVDIFVPPQRYLLPRNMASITKTVKVNTLCTQEGMSFVSTQQMVGS